MEKGLFKQFIAEIKWPLDLKRCPVLLIAKEMHIKTTIKKKTTTISYHLPTIGLVKVKKSDCF